MDFCEDGNLSMGILINKHYYFLTLNIRNVKYSNIEQQSMIFLIQNPRRTEAMTLVIRNVIPVGSMPRWRRQCNSTQTHQNG